MFEINNFFNVELSKHGSFISEYSLPWDIVKNIPAYAERLIEASKDEQNSFSVDPSVIIKGEVYIGKGCTIGEEVILKGPIYIGKGSIIEERAILKGPIYVGENCYIGTNVLIRPNTILGDGSVVGNACELKNCLVLEKARVSHFCFVGDSVVGIETNIGGFSATANFSNLLPLEDDGSTIIVNYRERGKFDTGLRHLGAIIGDKSRIGSQCTLQPGTLLGREVMTDSAIVLKRYIPPSSIVHNCTKIEIT